MGIWTYSDVLTKDAVSDAIHLPSCPFCMAALEALGDATEESPAGGVELRVTRDVKTCPVCGWWVSTKTEFTTLPHDFGRRGSRALAHQAPPPHEVRVFGAAACLKQLSLSDLSVPIEEVRAFLAARYEDRFRVHPRKFEEVVASVFADLGYSARVTAYSGDDGLDVILDGTGGEVVGVQVKRYRGKISVEQIRSLAGALVFRGLTRGIFVTTSSFQSGTDRTVRVFRERGMPIELVDAPRFLAALHVAQRGRYQSKAEQGAPFTSGAHVLVSSSSHPLFDSIFVRRMNGEL